MPGRWSSLGIVVCWVAALSALIARDVAPRLRMGQPPPLSSGPPAAGQDRAIRWSIVAPGPNPDDERSLGEMTTTRTRSEDGGAILSSQVRLDATRLLEQTPFARQVAQAGAHAVYLEIETNVTVAPDGDLGRFETRVVEDSSGTVILTMNGVRSGEFVEFRAKGAGGAIDLRERFPYPGGAMVQNGFGPLDRMEGLRLGQRWSSQVVDPITSQVRPADVEVRGPTTIRWRGRDVRTWEVVTKLPLNTARSWVRVDDGLILRQEAPIPFVKVILERLDAAKEDSLE